MYKFTKNLLSELEFKNFQQYLKLALQNRKENQRLKEVMNTQENDNDGEWHFSEESIKKADLPTWEWDKQQNNSVDSKSSSNSSMNQSSSSQKKSQDEI